MKMVFSKQLGYSGIDSRESNGKTYHTLNVVDVENGERFQLGCNDFVKSQLDSHPVGSVINVRIAIDRNYSEAKKSWYTFVNAVSVLNS